VNVLIDDHLLRDVLLQQEPPWLSRARSGDQLSTTGLWYYRLCSALRAPTIIGSLSGPIADLPGELRSRVLGQVVALPAAIRLLSLRDLSWSAADYATRYGLNVLAAEAIAAAVLTRSVIATALGNLPPRLAAAAEGEGVRVLSARSA
jgi:hypothetical protein